MVWSRMFCYVSPLLLSWSKQVICLSNVRFNENIISANLFYESGCLITHTCPIRTQESWVWLELDVPMTYLICISGWIYVFIAAIGGLNHQGGLQSSSWTRELLAVSAIAAKRNLLFFPPLLFFSYFPFFELVTNQCCLTGVVCSQIRKWWDSSWRCNSNHSQLCPLHCNNELHTAPVIQVSGAIHWSEICRSCVISAGNWRQFLPSLHPCHPKRKGWERI